MGSPRLPFIPDIRHAMLSDPGAQRSTCLDALPHVDFCASHRIVLPICNLSWLNHFSLRLRPNVLFPLCLIFGVTSADPEFTIQRLACLTGSGFAPAGIHDLAWPHAKRLLCIWGMHDVKLTRFVVVF